MNENRERAAHDLIKVDDLSDEHRSIPSFQMLSAVANEHRIAILESLHTASEHTLEYEALVDSVAENIRHTGEQYHPDEFRQRIRIALHHTHLPKLEEVQIIDYEPETGVIRLIEDTLAHAFVTQLHSLDTDQ